MPGGGGPGMPGMPGGGGPGMPGMPGMPGGGGPGMPGMPGMPGGGGGSSSGLETYESYVIAVVHVSPTASLNQNILPQQYGIGVRQYLHKWGRTALFNDDSTIQIIPVAQETPRQTFAARKKAADKTRDAERYLNLSEWALNHGLLIECENLLQEIEKLKDLSPRVQAALKAYAEVRTALAKPSAGVEAVNAWKAKLTDYQLSVSNEGHYAIFYSPPERTPPPWIERRKQLLEQQMRAFYLWFALRGKALPVPEEKLVAVQVHDMFTFKAQRATLESVQHVSDGFYAPRDNVAVFSSQRLDEAYQMFRRITNNHWKVWNREELVEGKKVTGVMGKIKQYNNDPKAFLSEYGRMQTIALLEKALEEEADLAAVSHEGTRQLLVATGLVGRNVQMPEWVQFGIASLFETPKGPFVGLEGTAQVAYWSGFGGPSWAYLRQFKKWATSSDPLVKLDAPADALRNTVADAYFHQVRGQKNLEIDPKLSKSEREKRERELAKIKEGSSRARAQAWALTFYLAKYRLDDLLAYCRELSSLPRDLEVDDQTQLELFARAFKLTGANGAIDEARLRELGTDWFDKIIKEDNPGRDEVVAKPIKREDNNNPGGFGPGGPGMPGMPGGGPGGPGAPGGGGAGSPG